MRTRGRCRPCADPWRTTPAPARGRRRSRGCRRRTPWSSGPSARSRRSGGRGGRRRSPGRRRRRPAAAATRSDTSGRSTPPRRPRDRRGHRRRCALPSWLAPVDGRPAGPPTAPSGSYTGPARRARSQSRRPEPPTSTRPADARPRAWGEARLGLLCRWSGLGAADGVAPGANVVSLPDLMVTPVQVVWVIVGLDQLVGDVPNLGPKLRRRPDCVLTPKGAAYECVGEFGPGQVGPGQVGPGQLLLFADQGSEVGPGEVRPGE